MGQLNSVILPVCYKDIISDGDKIFPHLRLDVTQKYHYSADEHHYSLVKRRVHGTLVVTPTDLYVFRHRSVALHVRLDDQRWQNKKIVASYEDKKLCFQVDIKAFDQEIKKSIFTPPKKFENGTLFLECNVSLPHDIVDRICHERSEWDSPLHTPSGTPSPSYSPTSSSSSSSSSSPTSSSPPRTTATIQAEVAAH